MEANIFTMILLLICVVLSFVFISKTKEDKWHVELMPFIVLGIALFAFIIQERHNVNTIKESLIKDNKAKYVCDKFGETKFVLTDSTSQNIFNLIKEK